MVVNFALATAVSIINTVQYGTPEKVPVEYWGQTHVIVLGALWFLANCVLNTFNAAAYHVQKQFQKPTASSSIAIPLLITVVGIGYVYFSGVYAYRHASNHRVLDKVLNQPAWDYLFTLTTWDYLLPTLAPTVLIPIVVDGAFRNKIMRRIEKFNEEILLLKKIQIQSKDWTDTKWRRKEAEKNLNNFAGSHEEALEQWLDHWQRNCRKDFNLEAWVAANFLGENFERTRRLFLNDNAEQIKRWAMITRKKVPECQ